jgi:hypothetical protein
MPSDYEEDKEAPEPEAEPAPAPEKKKRNVTKMTDKQKADLTKHMEKMTNMTATEKKSHRMKLMARMRKGMTVKKAHNDIVKNN